MTSTPTYIPTLIDTIVSKATTALPSVNVFDGFGVTEDPGDFLMVGVDDPDGPSPADTASSSQDFGPIRTSPRAHDEQGEIVCAALSWNGDVDPKAARDAAAAILTGVATFLRDDPSLGLAPTLLWARFGSALNLTQQQSDSGAMAMFVFRIAFRARI